MRLVEEPCPTSPAATTTSASKICTSCDSVYVHPVEWGESGDANWWMLLRCGECRMEREVTVADHIAPRFGETLDAAAREIERAVARLDAERMAVEVELFAAALERNFIGPPTSAADPAWVRPRPISWFGLGHHERVAGAAGGERLTQTGAVAVGAGQAMVDVDALGGHAERPQAVAGQ